MGFRPTWSFELPATRAGEMTFRRSSIGLSGPNFLNAMNQTSLDVVAASRAAEGEYASSLLVYPFPIPGDPGGIHYAVCATARRFRVRFCF